MNNKHLIDKALNYIELHLREKLHLEDIAEVANYSPWHFHRLFVATTGITVGEYIRKRRLSEASRELAYTNKPIKQLASDYQFESQAAFTRSFKSFSGSTPGQMRRCLQPLLHFQAKLLISKKGEIMQNPKIIHKTAFKVIGISCQSTMKNNTIPALWDDFMKICDKIPNATEKDTAYGICFFEKMPEMTDDTPFTYMASLEVATDAVAAKGFQCRQVPEADYAVFEHKGSLDTLHDTYAAIYGEWLPQSGYERCNTDDFERYGEDFAYGKPESVMGIWVPVVKR